MNIPDHLRYTEDHEWIRLEEGNIAYVGITDYAQQELDELVYIEVESVGETLSVGEIFGTVEAVKRPRICLCPSVEKSWLSTASWTIPMVMTRRSSIAILTVKDGL